MRGHEPAVEPPNRKKADAAALFRAHARSIARALRWHGVRPAELDDAVQTVFMKVLGFLDKDPDRETKIGWLYSIAEGVAHDLRRKRSRSQVLESTVAEADAREATQLESLVQKEAFARIQDAFDKLGHEHRTTFLLREIEEESCESIADCMRIPVGTVYSRLHHVRSVLLKAYSGPTDNGSAPNQPGKRRGSSGPAANQPGRGESP
jgi:RNA polymerase sigma-70 factor (ECF subfamily)